VLNSAAQSLTCTGAPSAVAYQITSPTLELGLITISDLAMGQIQSMTGGSYSWSSIIYRNFRQTHPQGQAQNSILIPARFSSLRWIVTTMREAANQENAAKYSVSDHIKNNLVSYQLKVGSSYASMKPIDCTGNAVSAYMALRALGGDAVSGEHMAGLIDRTTWSQQVSAVPGTDQPGSFKVCQSLMPYSNQSALLSGTSTQASPLFLDLNFDPTVASTAIKSVVVDCLVAADSLCTVSSGDMNISF
jgi:hypothetical protein